MDYLPSVGDPEKGMNSNEILSKYWRIQDYLLPVGDPEGVVTKKLNQGSRLASFFIVLHHESKLSGIVQ